MRKDCTEHLQKLAEKLESWEQLALPLGLSDDDVSAIKQDATESQPLAALVKWQDKYGKKATYKVLAETLVDIQEMEAAHELVKQIVPQVTARKIVHTLVQTIYVSCLTCIIPPAVHII